MWLYGAQTFGIKLGLDNVRDLLVSAGNPQERLRFLHVAGTNGKGSTCAMMEAMLRAGGIRSGLYTSPHLLDFRERIQVRGIQIPEEAVAEGLTLLRGASKNWEYAPTFFELTTVLAAWWFARAGVEIVVWETGLGGRLDATNVVQPLVSVITPVGLDHQQWLGSTLADIAREKAGIIKPGIPVVSAPQEKEVRTVLEMRAAEVESPLRFVPNAYGGPIALAGEHQRWNASLALAALEAAGLCEDAEARRRGLESVSWPARFQRLGNTIVDGAHNPHAVAAFIKVWREIFGSRKKAWLIFSALNDKDPPAMLTLLHDIADTICVVPIHGERGCTMDALRQAAREAGFKKISTSELSEALTEGRRQKAPVVVIGSLFLAGEALAFLQGHSIPKTSLQ